MLALLALPSPAAQKGIRFWNLTAYTITDFELSPAGKNAWGKNQCLNDNDKSVDHDERLTIAGIAAGTYDAKLTDAKGRICIVANVAVKDHAVFSIDEKQLTNCQAK